MLYAKTVAAGRTRQQYARISRKASAQKDRRIRDFRQQIAELKKENETLKRNNLRQQQYIDSMAEATNSLPQTPADIQEREAVIEDAVHSIRGAIKGIPILLGSPDIPTEEKIKIAAFSLDQMTRLATNFLDIRKITSGQATKLTVSELNLREMFEMLLPKLTYQGQERKISTLVTVEETVPSIMYADANKIFFIIVNLCNNAIEHSHQHGTVNVTCSFSASESKLKLAVSDHGSGLTAEQINRFLTAGVIPHNPKEDPYSPSTGLGIKSVRENVKAMGGIFGIESIPEQETTFWFEVPIRPEQP